MSEIKPISVEIENRIAIIRFIRAAIKNPLSIDTLEVINEIFGELESNKKVTSIVFTGENDTFAAGANLKEVARLNQETAAEFCSRGQDLMQKIYRFDKRTVAAIDGFCIGGALDLALSCDMRIASPKSYFAHPGAKLGIITGWGGTQMLPRLIGNKRASEMFITARQISADQALKIGLVDNITENPLARSVAMLSKTETVK